MDPASVAGILQSLQGLSSSVQAMAAAVQAAVNRPEGSPGEPEGPGAVPDAAAQAGDAAAQGAGAAAQQPTSEFPVIGDVQAQGQDGVVFPRGAGPDPAPQETPEAAAQREQTRRLQYQQQQALNAVAAQGGLGFNTPFNGAGRSDVMPTPIGMPQMQVAAGMQAGSDQGQRQGMGLPHPMQALSAPTDDLNVCPGGLVTSATLSQYMGALGDGRLVLPLLGKLLTNLGQQEEEKKAQEAQEQKKAAALKALEDATANAQALGITLPVSGAMSTSVFAPKRDKPRVWDGTGERTPQAWLNDMLVTHQHNKAVTLECMPSNMSDKVRMKWDALVRNKYGGNPKAMTWDQANKEFVRLEGKEEGALKLAAHNALLKNQVMQTGAYSDYVDQFRSLVVHVQAEMHEHTQCLLFLNGLSTAMKEKCALDSSGKQWENLEALIEFGYPQANIVNAALDARGVKRPAVGVGMGTDADTDGAVAPAFGNRKQGFGGGRGRGEKRQYEDANEEYGGRGRGRGRGRDGHKGGRGNDNGEQGGRGQGQDRGGASQGGRGRGRGRGHQDMANVQCYECKGYGHFSYKCANKQH